MTPTGCDKCRRTGYLGRTGLFELMVMNEHLRGHILAKSAPDLIRRTAVQTGMRTLLMDGVLKASSGWTTLDEVLRVTAVMA
jgi:type II secretory ATPase GspE/PulE/Tfp pilus assembly ATPase PilB-like protein